MWSDVVQSELLSWHCVLLVHPVNDNRNHRVFIRYWRVFLEIIENRRCTYITYITVNFQCAYIRVEAHVHL